MLNATLVGPEPDVEASQEEYIDGIKQSHRKVCEMLSKVIVGAIDHHKEILRAASYSHEQLEIAEKRVEEMQLDVDKVRRVLVHKDSDGVLPRSSSLGSIVGSAGANASASADGGDGVSDRQRTGSRGSPARGSSSEQPPRTPDRRSTSSWEVGPPDSPTTVQSKRFATLAAVLSPSRLPNRSPHARHRRSTSEPVITGMAGSSQSSIVSTISPIDAKLAALEKAVMSAGELRAWKQVARRVGQAVDLQTLTQRDRVQVVRGFSSAKDPTSEASDCATKIAKWRAGVKFESLVHRPIPESEKFHSLWQETVYGEDCFGHPLIRIKVAEIDVSAPPDTLAYTTHTHTHTAYTPTDHWHHLHMRMHSHGRTPALPCLLS